MIILIFFFIIILILYLSFYIKFILSKYFLSIQNIKTENKNINDLFIFGTHDSLSYKINNFFSQFAKTQTLDLESQLKYGVRFFDLRFKIINNLLKGYHSFIDLNIDHKEIFDIFLNFLQNNKNQFIIISLKNENFKDHFLISEFLYNFYIKPNNLESYFIFNNTDWSYVPTIQEIKNKIFILNHVKEPFNNLPWADNSEFVKGSIYISDKYKDNIDDKIILYNKFLKNCLSNKINIFFSSMQFYNILGIKFMNKQLLNKIHINKRINHIFVSDYVENIL